MLAIMFISCYRILAQSSINPQTPQDAMLIRLAMPQLVLAVLTLTSFHVQIITRISSGYPLIYIFIASSLIDIRGGRSKWVSGGSIDYPQLITRWMVVYAIVQGGLFATFLPPA
jgi:phosphatidylinositol glycan class V